MVVSAFPDIEALAGFLADARDLIAERGDDLAVLDVGVADPRAFRALARSVRSASIVLHGARRLCWRQDGVHRSILYVDRVARDAARMRPLLGALAHDIVPVADAKAIGMLADLLCGVGTMLAREGLRIGHRAGVSTDILAAVLGRGSGATARLAEAEADEEGRAAGHPCAHPADFATTRRGVAAAVAIAHAVRQPLLLGAPAVALRGGPEAGCGGPPGAIAHERHAAWATSASA
jgi:hypothetical protein